MVSCKRNDDFEVTWDLVGLWEGKDLDWNFYFSLNITDLTEDGKITFGGTRGGFQIYKFYDKQGQIKNMSFNTDSSISGTIFPLENTIKGVFGGADFIVKAVNPPSRPQKTSSMYEMKTLYTNNGQ
ncbi:hypothetical protein MFMK1_000835 [Metallumcola ferriviriculae]|uniref:Uncharacterized protein n=1 Tax=Metallumcola ferriviriculae TaxID=3039180 RepID=A0AAU0UKJ0_9FIRM|nr:hypothetical protein MFMK1_000835 [Desulfitibacteraceae bacterium MK1]